MPFAADLMNVKATSLVATGIDLNEVGFNVKRALYCDIKLSRLRMLQIAVSTVAAIHLDETYWPMMYSSTVGK